MTQQIRLRTDESGCSRADTNFSSNVCASALARAPQREQTPASACISSQQFVQNANTQNPSHPILRRGKPFEAFSQLCYLARRRRNPPKPPLPAECG
jgi:hypothetical protein